MKIGNFHLRLLSAYSSLIIGQLIAVSLLNSLEVSSYGVAYYLCVPTPLLIVITDSWQLLTSHLELCQIFAIYKMLVGVKERKSSNDYAGKTKTNGNENDDMRSPSKENNFGTPLIWFPIDKIQLQICHI